MCKYNFEKNICSKPSFYSRLHKSKSLLYLKNNKSVEKIKQYAAVMLSSFYSGKDFYIPVYCIIAEKLISKIDHANTLLISIG